MRIWDIDPGYLNRQSLLAEHQELHGLFSVVRRRDERFMKRAEIVRWLPYLDALGLRHQWLVSEMELRGYKHHSPVVIKNTDVSWPSSFLIQPHQQFDELRTRYSEK